MYKFTAYVRILFFISVLGLADSAYADSLIYFSGGKEKELSTDKISDILKISDKLIAGTNNALKKPVGKQFIKELKSHEGIEINLSEEHQVVSANSQRNFIFSKLLIPFCAETSCADADALFIIGNTKNYYITPYINTKGEIYIEEIKQLIEQ